MHIDDNIKGSVDEGGGGGTAGTRPLLNPPCDAVSMATVVS